MLTYPHAIFLYMDIYGRTWIIFSRVYTINIGAINWVGGSYVPIYWQRFLVLYLKCRPIFSRYILFSSKLYISKLLTDNFLLSIENFEKVATFNYFLNNFPHYPGGTVESALDFCFVLCTNR